MTRMNFSVFGATHLFSLQLLVLCVICADRKTNSFWDNLQISSDPLCSMTYKDFRIKVFEHIKNPLTTVTSQKRYFYSPIAMLDHKSTDTEFNQMTKRIEMKFRVEMWNDHVQNEILSYLPQIVGHEVKSFQVQVIPFEKVLLKTLKPYNNINSMSTEWHPYQLEKSVWFTLTCSQETDCSELKDNIHKDPAKLDNLKLLFSLSSQVSKTEEIVINFKNVFFGQMISKITQKYVQNTVLYLTTEDTNQLLSEITSNVMMETFNDSDVVSSYSESLIYNIINDLLVSTKTTISKQDSILWKHMFWNDDFYRPDKITKTFNEIYGKLDTANKKKMLDPLINVIAELPGLKDEHVIKMIKDYVEWNGETFTPKPLLLCKINLKHLRDAHKIQDRRIRVSYSTAVFTIPVHIARINSISNTDGWLELKKEIKDFKLKHERDLQTAYMNLSVLRKELEDSATPDINFCANLGRSFSNKKEYVTYDYVERNGGSGLNRTTGIFAAPKAGTYLFTFTAVMNPRDNQILSIHLNGVSRAKIDNVKNTNGDSPWRTSSMSIILSLYVNDKVGVYLDQGAVRWSSYFCGILIRAIK